MGGGKLLLMLIQYQSIERINAIPPETYAHRAIATTVFHPDHLGQFLSPSQSIPCRIYAKQQHRLNGNVPLDQPNRLACDGCPRQVIREYIRHQEAEEKRQEQMRLEGL